MTDSENPRARIGDNLAPDYAREVTDRMRRDYRALAENVEAMLEEAIALPPTIDDDEVMGRYAKLIKRLRDEAKRIDALHDAEKQPHLRAGQAVDQFFFSLWDKVVRRARANKPGAADVLQARLDDYQQRKLFAEQERRRREAEARARIEREARERAEREAREAEQARLAAERARKPDTIEARGAAALEAQREASNSAIAAALASEAAQEARIASLARPAEIVRTRVDEGPLVTMAEEPYVEVIDSAQLDKEKLWPFISEAVKAQALRAWARNTGHTVPMNGASIGKRPRSVVR